MNDSIKNFTEVMLTIGLLEAIVTVSETFLTMTNHNRMISTLLSFHLYIFVLCHSDFSYIQCH